MRRITSSAVCFGAIAVATVLVVACESEESTGGSAAPDAAVAEVGPPPVDGATPAPDGGYCCPPDERPACCMSYGGFAHSDRCFTKCDGMPLPTAAGWRLVDDDYGCKVWSEPLGAKKCGEVPDPPDAGADAD